MCLIWSLLATPAPLLSILFLLSTNVLSTFLFLAHLRLPYLPCIHRFLPCPLSTLMRPFIPPDDLGQYRSHSGVAHSCLLTSLLRTAYSQEFPLHTLSGQAWWIWAPSHSFLPSLVSLLDMNSSVYFSLGFEEVVSRIIYGCVRNLN